MRRQTLGLLLALTLAAPAARADVVKEYLTTRIAWLATQRAPGLRAMGPMQIGPTDHDGESWQVAVQLEAGRCYALVGTSAATVEDADLYLFAPDGKRLGEDSSEGRDMFLLNCPTVSGQHQVELKRKEGRGDMALQVFMHGLPTDNAPTAEQESPTRRPQKRVAQRSRGGSRGGGKRGKVASRSTAPLR